MTTKIVQIAGDSVAIADAYTGPDREVRVDVDNHDLRLHDGVTAGGHKILNEVNADARYLAQTSEAAGITGFGAGDTGILTRLSVGSYRLREILDSGSSEVVVTNPDGYAGNILLGVADTFTRNKTFNAGAQGLFQGSFIGDVDVSTDTLVCANNQIQVSWINASQMQTWLDQHELWIGAVVFSTVTTGIPSNWALCNGANGTPDLRDKFLMMAGTTYTLGSSGGAATQTVTVNGHAISIAEMPVHNHGVTDPTHYHGYSDSGHNHWLNDPTHFHNTNVTGGGGRESGSIGTATQTAGVTDAQLTGITINPATVGITISAAATGISINNAGSGAAHTHTTNAISIIPPYYALAAYMRVS